MVKWRYVAAGGAAVIVLLAGGVFYKNITKHYDNMAADGIGIARTVGPNEWHNELEQEDLENNHDARSADISGLQIHKLTAAEPYLDFNTKTIWPAISRKKSWNWARTQALMCANYRKPALTEAA